MSCGTVPSPICCRRGQLFLDCLHGSILNPLGTYQVITFVIRSLIYFAGTVPYRTVQYRYETEDRVALCLYFCLVDRVGMLFLYVLFSIYFGCCILSFYHFSWNVVGVGQTAESRRLEQD